MSKVVLKKLTRAILSGKYTKEQQRKLLRQYQERYLGLDDWKKEATSTFDGTLGL